VPGTRRQFLAAAGVAGAALYIRPVEAKRPQADGPNVLLVIIDSLRADHAFGARAHTPAIDALAARSVSFPNVYPEAMPTVPARNSILSGRRGFPFRDWHDHRGLLAKPGWEPLDRLESSLPRTLWREGWWTAYVTDNPFLGFSQPYEPFRRSFDMFLRHGGQIGGGDRPVDRITLDHWLHPAVREAGLSERVRRYIANSDYSEDDSRSFAARVFTTAREALVKASRRRPFLLVADSFEPHEPWTPPRRYVDLYGDPDYSGPEPAMPYYGRVDNWLAGDEAAVVLARMRALYAANVTMTDRWLGTLLDQLHELGLEDDTVVLLLSDHGILIGERGWTGKISGELHPELINVPLLIADPDGRAAGTESGFLASTHDVAPTLLSMAGVEPPPEMDGVDLSPVFRGDPLPRRLHAYGGYTDSHFARDGRWAYMADNRRERERLYDLGSDPGERSDVAARHPDVIAELRAVVRAGAGASLPVYGD
jgi:arylsulfatase A-like enzyme